tara:strand:- start:775 stop:1632 length:858 start_codon:yes stop_codon:yes gene_type:complete
MITNDFILDIAYLCKLSYKPQNEVNEIFEKSEYPYKRLVESCLKTPCLHENKKTNDCEVYTVRYNNNLIIIFRGTESLRDVLSDLNIIKEPLLLNNYQIHPKVHSGFLKQFNSVTFSIEKVITEFKQEEPSGSIIICGHSLGGAIATIAAIKYTLMFEMPVYCITFGAPRAGDYNFADIFNDKIISSIRIINEDDPVPLVPLPLTYSHVKGIRWLYRNDIKTKSEQCCKWVRFFRNFFLSCSTCCLFSAFSDHSMDNYIDDLVNIESFENSDNITEHNEIEIELK